MMNSERIIEIKGLEVMACVGVPDDERTTPQRLLLDLRFAARDQPDDLAEDITRTVDYHSVSLRVEEITKERPRKLIETLADEISSIILEEYRLTWIEVSVRKFILPQTEWVSVSVRRETP
jgi:FolB domain-containing protein